MYVQPQLAPRRSAPPSLLTWGAPLNPTRRDAGVRGLGATPSITAGTKGPLGTTMPPGATQDMLAVAQQCQPSTGTRPGDSQDTINLMVASMMAGQILTAGGNGITPFNPATITGCNGVAPANPAATVQLIGQAGSLGLVGVSTGAAIAGATAIGSVVPIIGTIVGAIVGLFAAIFAHHSMVNNAILKDVCSLVPAANNYLSIIQNAVATGQQTPAQAVQALQSLKSDFHSQAAGFKYYNDCNALCVYDKVCCAVCGYLIKHYQAAAAVAAAPTVTTVVNPTTGQVQTVAVPASSSGVLSSLSTPELLVGAAIIFLLMK